MARVRRRMSRTVSRSRWRAYGRLLEAARDAGYAVVSLEDFVASAAAREAGRVLVLRHDVDQHPATALAMHRIERDLGLTSTWYLRWRTADPQVIAELRAGGQHVGLHYETLTRTARRLGTTNAATLRALVPHCREVLRGEIQEFARRFGPVTSVAAHGDSGVPGVRNTDLLVGEDPADYGIAFDANLGLPAGTSLVWLTDRSAAEGLWGKGLDPGQLLAEGRSPILCLTHPNNWVSGVGLWRDRALARVAPVAGDRSEPLRVVRTRSDEPPPAEAAGEPLAAPARAPAPVPAPEAPAARPPAAVATGPAGAARVEGRIDTIARGRVMGWAWDPEAPGRRLPILVRVDGEDAGTAVAERARPDLVKAGIGDGAHAFAVPLPDHLRDGGEHALEVLVGARRLPLRAAGRFATQAAKGGGADPWAGTRFVVPSAEPEPDARANGAGAPAGWEQVPVPRYALVGEEGWLFGVPKPSRDARDLWPRGTATRPSASQVRALRARVAALAGIGTRYVIAVAPSKQQVYPDMLPAGMPRPGHRTAPAVPGVALELLDLTPCLVDAREQGQVFDRTGSRWNERGALAVARAVCEWLELDPPPRAPASGDPALALTRRRGDLARRPKLRWSPGGAVLSADHVRVGPEEAPALPLPDWKAAELPVPRHLTDGLTGRFRHFEQPAAAGELAHAVVVDDYGDELLLRLLAERFRRCVWVRSDEFPGDAVELEAPDVVIHVVPRHALNRVVQ